MEDYYYVIDGETVENVETILDAYADLGHPAAKIVQRQFRKACSPWEEDERQTRLADFLDANEW